MNGRGTSAAGWLCVGVAWMVWVCGAAEKALLWAGAGGTP